MRTLDTGRQWTLAVLLSASFSVANAQTYLFQSVGTANLPFTPRAINNAGQVVGAVADPTTGYAQPVLQDGSVSTTLATLGTGGTAVVLNNSGQVAGYSTDKSGVQYPVVWTNGLPVILSLPAGSSGAAINGINDAGVVVGSTSLYPYYGPTTATAWSGNSTAALGSLFDGGNSSATGINNTGQIVGFVNNGLGNGYGVQRAVTWNGAIPTALASLGVNNCCDSANAINDSGVVVGSSVDINENTRAVMWIGTQPTALAQMSGADVALALNNFGFAVGADNVASGFEHAVMWNTNTNTAIDLNSLLTADELAAGWELKSAYGINDSGAIIGTDFNRLTGSFSAFMLTPVPEPTSLTILAILGAGYLLRRASNGLYIRYGEVKLPT